MVTPDPVTDPQGALSAMALDPMRQMMQQSQQGHQQTQEQIDQLKDMIKQAPKTDDAERWAAMAHAAAAVPPVVGNFGMLLAQVGGAYGKTLAAQNQAQIVREAELAKLMQQAAPAGNMSSMASMLNATGNVNVPGVGLVNRMTGEVVVKSNLMGEYGKLYSAFYKTAVDEKMDNPEQWAREQTQLQLGAPMGSPEIAGGRAVGTVTPQALITTSPPPSVDIQADGGLSQAQTTAKWIDRLKQEEKTAAASGDYARALEVKKALTTLQGVAPAQQPPAGPRGLQYENKPATAARKVTAEKSAETYAKRFEEDVVIPAASFSDTSKVMQDFNTLGQMQHALKNGKIKEFMVGEGGKYLLPLLPDNSDLRKGIANAQEAERLTASMTYKLLLPAKGVQTEGDAKRVRSQATSIGSDPDANKYIEAYVTETARQLKAREQLGLEYKEKHGTFEGYDNAWRNSPIMQARGSVKKIGSQWIGVTQYMEKLKQKYPQMSDSDAIASWHKVK